MICPAGLARLHSPPVTLPIGAGDGVDALVGAKEIDHWSQVFGIPGAGLQIVFGVHVALNMDHERRIASGTLRMPPRTLSRCWATERRHYFLCQAAQTVAYYRGITVAWLHEVNHVAKQATVSIRCAPYASGSPTRSS